MFNIHRNRDKVRMQSILKSNSSNFLLSNFFPGWILKKLTPRGKGEVGEPSKFLLGSGKLVFTNIQAISTLLCLQLDDNGLMMCNCSIYTLWFPNTYVFIHINEFSLLNTLITRWNKLIQREKCIRNATALRHC